MKKVAVLRSNPKDATFIKILMPLSRRYAVDCYLWDREGDYAPGYRNENIRYFRFMVRAGYYNVSTLLKLLLFEIWLFGRLLFAKVDCIHAIDLDTGFAGLLAARLKRKPFVYQCIDPYYACLPPGWPKFLGRWAKRMENYVISAADLFLITDLLRMPQHSGANPRHVLEYPNFPPLDIPETGKVPGGELVVGYIGSLIEGRNLLPMMETVGDLEGERVRLTIGGFGPLERVIETKAKEYKNVSYIGWVPYADVLKVEDAFDVFVHTTDPKNESQKWVSPNKLFESMALGKPIIVSSGTLTAQRVSMIGNGVAIEYGSKSALRESILMLKNDAEFARQLGRRGKEEFHRAWTYEIMEKRLLDAYQDVVPLS